MLYLVFEFSIRSPGVDMNISRFQLAEVVFLHSPQTCLASTVSDQRKYHSFVLSGSLSVAASEIHIWLGFSTR